MTSMKYIYGCYLCIIIFTVYPEAYFTLASEKVSVNGSLPNGPCNGATLDSSMVVCNTPQDNSLLFDGDIPVLTGLDGGQWASGLVTLNASDRTAEIKFTFNQFFFVMNTVQVVMFNCPHWGISAKIISIFYAESISDGGIYVKSVIPNTSCDSLVRVCASGLLTVNRVITVQFLLDDNLDWVHIAEVTFFSSNTSDCPPVPTQIHSTPTTSANVLPTLFPTPSPTASPTGNINEYILYSGLQI